MVSSGRQFYHHQFTPNYKNSEAPQDKSSLHLSMNPNGPVVVE